MVAFESTATAESRGLALKSADGGRPRLLLAEDCDPVRIVTAAMLKGMGCDVEAACHGEEAVRLASEQRFDLIVLDIEMPIMDGITAAKSIRKLGGECRGTPLMALSAFLADASQQASWNETFDLALPKPTSKLELHAAIHQALSWTPARDMTRNIEGEPVVQGSRIVELRTGLETAVWSELVDLARRDIASCMAVIEDLISGLEFESIKPYAFKLRAIGRTFAAPRLSLAAQKLEKAENRREIEIYADHLREVITETLATLAG